MKGLTFTGPMILAWLSGNKTVTRRLVGLKYGFQPFLADGELRDAKGYKVKPRYLPGETIYIKEVWRTDIEYNSFSPSQIDSGASLSYRAMGQEWENGSTIWGRWRSPMFMPEWASRSHALIKSVRPERVQEINEIDAYLEGFRDQLRGETFWPVGAQFKEIWETIHPGSWESNPWVWRYELEKIKEAV